MSRHGGGEVREAQRAKVQGRNVFVNGHGL